MSPQDFVTNSNSLGSLQVRAALFAGCKEFTESSPVLEAAKKALKNVRTLVIIHNRNLVSDLVAWFPAVTTLVLYHDLKLQNDREFRMQGLDNHLHLERLIGTTPAMGADHLLIMPVTSVNLLFNCPKLNMVRAFYLNVAGGGDQVPSAASIKYEKPPVSFTCEEAWLGCTLTAENGVPVGLQALNADEVASITRDRELCGRIKTLRLTTAMERSLADAASFSNVTDLSLSFASPTSRCRFDPHVVDALSRLTLESLSLTNIGDVCVSAIAKRCRGLERLGLIECVVLDEDIDENAVFQCLRILLIASSLSERTFFVLLRSCPCLTELQLYDDALTTAFIVGLQRFSCEHQTLYSLERLTLHTNVGSRSGLSGRQELPADLDRMLALLPALRKVCTDDYRLRLHFENRAPWVDLRWGVCMVCFAEYPKMDALQEEMWRKLHYPK
ncbi:hypothetical protein HPB49_006603 [Dermacentor silvarum]|uniref:Uncharacterized protein n=1 Tax=Dermacentor silvarum TaxID=543639 RepID=A0ACB8C2E7_DERSI|nr:hypothetical protein HPB49_006603 [Dermacentor silvarum]